MAEATSELMYEILKRMQQDMVDLKNDSREIKARLSNLEVGQANLDVRLGNLRVEFASRSARMDRRDEVFERVLRRHDLVEPA